MEASPLILPGDPEFDYTLSTALPPDWQVLASNYGGDYGFVADVESGLLRIENTSGIREYVEGGEYDDRLAFIDEDEDEDVFYWVE